MATKRKVAATKAIPNLSERVEELASNMVLGGTDGEQWAVLLSGMRDDAVTAGRADVAGIAAEALDALSKGHAPGALDAHCFRQHHAHAAGSERRKRRARSAQRAG